MFIILTFAISGCNLSKKTFTYAEVEMPIGIWVGPPDKYVSVESYQDIKNIGVTWLPSNVTSNEEIMKALDFAQAAGLKYLVADSSICYMTPEFLDGMGEFIDVYKDHPAYMGNFIWDEPAGNTLEKYGAISRKFKELQPDKLAYVNIYPTYSDITQRGGMSYLEYLDKYIAEMKPDVISYDHYPFIEIKDGSIGEISEDYFYNLEIISDKAREVNKPFWLFIQTLSYTNHRSPSEEEMRWQINTSLAYGCKGLQYFTYWWPGNSENFGLPLIDGDGNKTPKYDQVKRLNTELKNYDDVLMSLDHKGVMYFMPEDQKPYIENELQSFELIKSVLGDPVIIGCFEGAEGYKALYVCNNSYKTTSETTINFSKSTKGYQFDKNGKSEVAGKNIKLTLEPGQGILLVLK